MKLSKLNVIPTTREMIDVFHGYNHNLRIGEGEFYDMKNLTSADYPVLSPRPKRGIFLFPQLTEQATGEGKYVPNPQGMISKDALCYVDNGTFYINKYGVDGLKLESVDGLLDKETKKTLISMGSYVIIMPDKKYINTEDLNDYGNIEAEFPATTGVASFTLCKLNGDAFKTDEEGNAVEIPYGDTEPSEPKNLDLWIDTSSSPHVLKQYSASSSQWVSVATTYIKITFNTTYDLTELFAEGDGVTISGIEDESLSDLNGAMILQKVGSNYVIVTGILTKVDDQDLDEKPIYIKRLMPTMDFIIESQNRLWGCHYGIALNGQVVNEIYASKLGDFKNWNSFAGISTDSYVASVGTDGQFTGAITHLGYPIFFKENCMHKVYGNYPANYQIQTTACRGVQKGCSKSLAIVNETLYYKSRSAVCAYDGSLPVEISSALGDVSYSDAAAGVLGNKYYISMKDDAKDHWLFVYDTAKGMWHKEDKTQAVEFCNCDGNLYYIEDAPIDEQPLKMVLAPTDEKIGYKEKTPIEWEAITGIIGTDSPDKKYISRLIVRLSLEIGTTVIFLAEYDSSGAWEHLFTMSGTTLKTFSIPIRPKRCDHLRLRILGTGEAKIYSICKSIEQGSDI